MALIGGAALYFFKFRKPKADTKGGDELDEFVEYARKHPELHFLVTAIGCGIAGFDADDIAPLFEEAKDIENISLPDEFWDVLE